MTWQLYQKASSLEQWLKLGRENCKLSSALMVEQLHFWNVCIQNGYCVSYFSNIFLALCLWLNPPIIEKLVKNNVLSEYASISEEAYRVLESLAKTLPNFYSHKFPSDRIYRISKGFDDNVETWSWSHVSPMVYLAVMHMLSRVLEKVIPEDTIGLQEDGDPKTGICNPSQGFSFSQEEHILSRGILMESLFELRCVFNILSKLVALEWHFVQSVEIVGRRGPDPGVGLG
ncbi:hypothetical protein REPUB_Repub04eG0035200 [Reevesia pubescens]